MNIFQEALKGEKEKKKNQKNKQKTNQKNPKLVFLPSNENLWSPLLSDFIS